ncbi:unnamed protein product, partial [Prorocentrum cordatum]
ELEVEGAGPEAGAHAAPSPSPTGTFESDIPMRGAEQAAASLGGGAAAASEALALASPPVGGPHCGGRIRKTTTRRPEVCRSCRTVLQARPGQRGRNGQTGRLVACTLYRCDGCRRVLCSGCHSECVRTGTYPVCAPPGADVVAEDFRIIIGLPDPQAALQCLEAGPGAAAGPPGEAIAAVPAMVDGAAFRAALGRVAAQPTPGTLERVPAEILSRAALVCRDALRGLAEAYAGVSSLAVLAGALILRIAQTLLGKILGAIRVDLAELGRRRELVELYENESRKREKRSATRIRAADRPPASDTDERHKRVIAIVEEKGINRAIGVLLDALRPARTPELAEEMRRLVAVDTDADEQAAIARAIAGAAADRAACMPTVPTKRRVRRAVRGLQPWAAPGPSGWRNSLVSAICEADGGEDALAGLAAIALGGRWLPQDGLLWDAAILEPVDQGIWPPAAAGEPASRKIRPIGLCEPLVKLAEAVGVEAAIHRARGRMEPHQLGNTPDGIPMLVRLQQPMPEGDQHEGKDVEAEVSAGEGVSMDQCIVKTDLENACGRLFRSSLLATARRHVPDLLPLLAGRWAAGYSVVWQRVGVAWVQHTTWRGGIQGSRLMQLLFNLDIADAMRGVCGCDPAVASPAVALAGVADDWCIAGDAGPVGAEIDALEGRLARRGHRMRGHQCAVTFPALDASGGAPFAAARSLLERMGREVHGLLLLGTALGGSRSTTLAGAVAMEGPALARAAQAEQVGEALCCLARSRCHRRTAQTAWAILVHSPARELDYDMRLCASGVLRVARARLQAAVVQVLEVLTGSPLDAADVDAVGLPPRLGGMGVRLPAGPEAAASYLACWSAHAQDVRRLAAALGRPLHHDPDAVLAGEAASRLRAFGVDFTPGLGMAFTAEAQIEYASGPFVVDTPVSDAFSFVGDIDDSSPAPYAALDSFLVPGPPGPPGGASERRPEPQNPSESCVCGRGGPTLAEAAPAPRGVDSGSLLLQRDLEGSRRRLLGRLFRGLDALRATRLWRRIADDDERQRNLLSHAGRSKGTFWLAILRARWMQARSAIWQIAFLRRLGVAFAPPAATCRPRRAPAVEDAGVEVQECGETLGRRAARALACPRSATRLRAHSGAVRGLEEELRSAGAVVDLERRVPELYRTLPDGAIQEAVMDLVVAFPANAERWWLDVNFRSPFNASLADAGRAPGAAAAAGDRAKASRYGGQVRSIAVEAGGRLSDGAAAALA